MSLMLKHDIFTRENYSLTCCLLFKKYLGGMISYFSCVYIINRVLHGASWRYEISPSCVKKYFTRPLRSLVKNFSTREEKFRISNRPCNILYLSVLSYPLLEFLVVKSFEALLSLQWSLSFRNQSL